jgi:hypothetical protein
VHVHLTGIITCISRRYYEDESFDDDTAAWLNDVQREFQKTKAELLGE